MLPSAPKAQRRLTADWGRRPLLPSVPIARKKVLHYLTLDIIGDTPTRPRDKAGDLSSPFNSIRSNEEGSKLGEGALARAGGAGLFARR
jgi:hypothetical protein